MLSLKTSSSILIRRRRSRNSEMNHRLAGFGHTFNRARVLQQLLDGNHSLNSVVTVRKRRASRINIMYYNHDPPARTMSAPPPPLSSGKAMENINIEYFDFANVPAISEDLSTDALHTRRPDTPASWRAQTSAPLSSMAADLQDGHLSVLLKLPRVPTTSVELGGGGRGRGSLWNVRLMPPESNQSATRSAANLDQGAGCNYSRLRPMHMGMHGTVEG